LAVALVLLAAGRAVGLAQCSFPSTASGRVINYSFDPTITPAGMVLHVRLEFRGGSEGMEEIEVPTEWAGQDLHAVTNLHALSQETVITESGTSGTKTIRYPSNQAIVLGYDLVKDWTGPFIQPVYNNQPEKMATFHIRTEAGPKVIEYYPRRTVAGVPQYALDQKPGPASPIGLSALSAHGIGRSKRWQGDLSIRKW
jgi:hypothetical protein